MTAFVRSVFPKRNPRNVPLDLYDASGPPAFPDWFNREGLTREEREFRDRAIAQQAERWQDTLAARRAAARESYVAILAEVIRGMGEAARRLEHSGLLRGSLEPKDWLQLGQDLSSLCRDAIAARLIVDILDFNLFESATTVQLTGKKKSTERLRADYEDRVVLFDRWIRARVAFETRSEILGERALRPTKGSAKALEALRELQAYVARAQASIAAGKVVQSGSLRPVAFQFVMHAYFSTGETLAILNDTELVEAFEEPRRVPLRSFEAKVKKAEKLAAKGQPGISRKLAREAALREGDELKENPFVRGILGYA